MKPYYQDSHVTIYHGDCREVLPALSCGGVSCVVADPPYEETGLRWDKRIECWPDMVAAYTPETASMWCFGTLRMFMATTNELAGWHLSQEVVWEKHNSSNFHADRFKRTHELVALFYRRDVLWANVYHAPQYTADATNRTVRRKERPHRPAHLGRRGPSNYVSEDGGPRMMRSVLRVRSCHGEAQHPTQKPLGILSPLIAYSCPTGGMILDFCIGSGSTLRAAKDLNCKAIGIEIEERYCEIAATRLSQEVLPLFDTQPREAEQQELIAHAS